MLVALNVTFLRDECCSEIQNKSATLSSQMHGEAYSLTCFGLLIFSITCTLYKPDYSSYAFRSFEIRIAFPRVKHFPVHVSLGVSLRCYSTK